MNIAILSKVPFLSALTEEELVQLSTRLTERELSAGETLFYENEVDDRVFVLLEGQVEVIKALDTPGERLLGVREGSAVFGEMSLFNPERRRSATLRARTHIKLLEIHHDEFKELLLRHPGLALEMLRTMSQRLDSSENATIQDLLEKNRQLAASRDALAQAYQELQAAQAQIIEKEKLERELDLARQIQTSLLPRKLPVVPGIQFGAFMAPARVVGGDLYDFFPLRDKRLGIVVGDVSDKGMPAALYMSLTYSLIRAEAARAPSPALALQAVNGHLMRMEVSLMFVTVLYAQLDRKSGELRYARAGHPPPLILDPDGQFIDLPVTGGQFLGALRRPMLDEQQLSLAPGSIALFYSDGLTEVADAGGQQFEVEGAIKVLRANRDRSAQEICERLWSAVQDHSGLHQNQDDVTLVCMKVGQS